MKRYYKKVKNRKSKDLNCGFLYKIKRCRMENTKTLETATRKKIDLILSNLGWKTDEDEKNCNVFTERAKTKEQNKKLNGKQPDYVLYKSGTDEPIAVIEAKRKGQNVEKALKDAIELYAKPLGINIVFAIDGTFVKTWFIKENKELSIEGETIHELLQENQILQHLRDGADINLSKEIKYSREELIKIFKWANEQLRKEGLRVLDRFIEFANILFLKLITEIEENKEIEGIEERLLAEKYCWNSFANFRCACDLSRNC
jgi:type I restriction enzyme M protein